MTTQRVRVPRKSKVWATTYQSNPVIPVDLGTGQARIIADLLADYRTSMGISNTDRVTAMRIVGSATLIDGGASTLTSLFEYRLGIAWVSAAIASATAGDAQIPEPLVDGVREAQWIQTRQLYGVTDSSLAFPHPAQGVVTMQVGQHVWDFDITQMRKQPTPDSKLCLIGEGIIDANQDVDLNFTISTMIALS